MRRTGWALLAAIAPIPVLAQQATSPDVAEVVVRSGRHPTFTRLTFALPHGAAWQLGREGANSYLLRLDLPASFDTSTVYQRIGTEQIAALSAGASELRIDLGCDCYAEAFMATPSLLAIDLRAGPAPTSARFEAPLTPSTPAMTDAQISPPRGSSGTDIGVPLVFRPRPEAEAVPDLSALEQALMESFARAAAQGLVDSANPQPRRAAVAAAPLSASTEESAVEVPPAPAVPGIAAQTSLERDSGLGARDRLSRNGEECISDDTFAFARWVNGTSFEEAIASGFANLYTVNEAVTRDGVASLARSYLHFGFGREASAVAGLYPLPDAGVARLAALGRIIDEDRSGDTAFAGQLGCLGAVSLWSVLEQDALPPLRTEDRIAIISALRDLPEPLRGQMGLRLARLFLAAAEVETAQTIMTIGTTATSYGAEGVSSLIADHLGGAMAALSVLRQAQGDGMAFAPDSLLAVVDAVLARQETPPAALLEMVAATRFAARGTAVGAQLAAGQARLMLARGALQDAKSFLAQPDLGLPPADLRALRDELLVAQTATFADLAFLTEALAEDAAHVGGYAGNLAARRLIDLGFADQALVFLATSADSADMAERRYLRAEAAAQTGQTTIGLAALTGLTDPRAEALRLSLTGPVMAVDGDARAWRTGDWTALASADDAIMRAAALEMAAPTQQALSVDSLAQAELLLSNAASARALADDLLGQFAVPR